MVITASNAQQALAVEDELDARVAAKQAPWAEVTCFVVPDPSNARVGSGGATFNALLTIQDMLSTAEVDVTASRVFLIHS